MKITILCENEAIDMVWLAEWGFSAFIEYNGINILFDAGFSDAYKQNAAHAGIDLESSDFVAISHFHRDHTRGFLYHDFKSPKKLILHPRVLTAKLKTDDQKILSDYRQIHATLQNDFDPLPSKNAVEFAEDCFFLGEIPRVTPFESGKYEDDAMADDTALAFRTDKGAVVVSGCSHAGICNICQHAKTVTGQPLYAVVGGFHLMAQEKPPVAETIAYFAQERPEILLPMHCIDFEYLAQIHHALGTKKLGAGSVIEL